MWSKWLFKGACLLGLVLTIVGTMIWKDTLREASENFYKGSQLDGWPGTAISLFGRMGALVSFAIFLWVYPYKSSYYTYMHSLSLLTFTVYIISLLQYLDYSPPPCLVIPMAHRCSCLPSSPSLQAALATSIPVLARRAGLGGAWTAAGLCVTACVYLSLLASGNSDLKGILYGAFVAINVANIGRPKVWDRLFWRLAKRRLLWLLILVVMTLLPGLLLSPLLRSLSDDEWPTADWSNCSVYPGKQTLTHIILTQICWSLLYSGFILGFPSRNQCIELHGIHVDSSLKRWYMRLAKGVVFFLCLLPGIALHLAALYYLSNSTWEKMSLDTWIVILLGGTSIFIGYLLTSPWKRLIRRFSLEYKSDYLLYSQQ